MYVTKCTMNHSKQGHFNDEQIIFTGSPGPKTKNLIITNLQWISEFMKFWLLANKIVDCKQKIRKNADAQKTRGFPSVLEVFLVYYSA